MSFNSTIFIFFFLVVFYAYWAISRTTNLRFMLLFVASCIFYMSWNVKFVFLLLFSTALDYYTGAAIHRTENVTKRRIYLAISLIGNLGLLGFFKYFNFFAENFHETLEWLGLAESTKFVPWNIVLPVGISFYTFQTLSYTIDIYRRELVPTDSFLKFALFVAFFPQLVAGPIVRASHFLPQLDVPARYDEERVARGVFLIAAGLIKKVVLADMIGVNLVDPVYASPGSHHPVEVVLGVWGALFQFYLDFSAYSDIAIGCAACLGYTLPINFRRPFLSQDLNEFWRRWHISMTSWFRDYVFVTLGGTRGGRFMVLRNVMITLLLTGLWHGAGWNYVIWGGMYGVVMILQGAFLRRVSPEERENRGLLSKLWRRAVTFNFLALSMLVFRNGTVAEGNRGIEGTLDMLASLVRFDTPLHGSESLGITMLAIAAVIHFTPKRWIDGSCDRWLRLPSPVQAAVLVLVTGSLAAVSYQRAPFIYFQF